MDLQSQKEPFQMLSQKGVETHLSVLAATFICIDLCPTYISVWMLILQLPATVLHLSSCAPTPAPTPAPAPEPVLHLFCTCTWTFPAFATAPAPTPSSTPERTCICTCTCSYTFTYTCTSTCTCTCTCTCHCTNTCTCTFPPGLRSSLAWGPCRATSRQCWRRTPRCPASPRPCTSRSRCWWWGAATATPPVWRAPSRLRSSPTCTGRHRGEGGRVQRLRFLLKTLCSPVYSIWGVNLF